MAGIVIATAGCRARSTRERLIAELGPIRPVEGRLSGASRFAPYRPASGPYLSGRGGSGTVRQVLSETGRHPSPQALGDRGFVELLRGQHEEAVAVLERATAAAPEDAGLLSDLAAAYIARSGDGLHPYDLVRALAKADRAVQIEPDRLESRFNRALALEKLPLVDEARHAWREVLAREPDPDWKAEVQRRLQKLDGPSAAARWELARGRLEQAAVRGDAKTVSSIVDRFPQPARLLAEEQLLEQWAEETAAGRPEAAERKLAVARAVGSALLRRGGDAMAHDAVAAIDAARAGPSPRRLRHLAAGHRSFGRGLRFYKARDLERAIPELAAARRELVSGGSPFADWAALYLASCDYFKTRLDLALAALGEIEARRPQERYPSLRGQIDWITGSMAALRGRPGEALPRFLRARELFARTGEVDYLSGALQQTALVYGALGSVEDAWKNLHAALRLGPRLQEPRRLAGVFDGAGLACERGDLPEAALHFHEASLALAVQLDDPEMIAAARLRRARSLSRLHRAADARRELAEARRATPRIPAETIRRRVESEILAAEAELVMAADPRAALRSLDEAIGFYERSGYDRFYLLAYFLRGRAWLGTGQPAPAERDFLAGLAAVEGTRKSVLQPRMRIAVQDQAAALYAETLAFLGERDGDAAFLVSERGHARQLLESMAVAELHAGSPQPGRELPLTRAEVQEDLAPGTVLVKYAVLDRALLVWTLRREGSSFRRVAVGQAELTGKIERVLAGLRAGKDRGSLPGLRELHRRLVPREALAGAREVVFIPDGALGLLPFAALVDPATGRYLVEDVAVGVAPSASVYARCLGRSRRQGAGPPASALVVGAEGFDRKRFPFLPALPQAAAEAVDVAARYPRPLLLTGRNANRSQFLEGLRQAPEVVHFAGHALPNLDLPELSMLLFVPEPGKADSGAVYSHEVYGLRLDGTRLAVLSACDTGTGRLSASEGPMGLARPFLAAGVPAVLATLGPVNDAESRQTLVAFHRALRAGQPAPEALRSAQVARLGAGGRAARPGQWASFEIIGAAAPAPLP